jgi:hypothetical protein
MVNVLRMGYVESPERLETALTGQPELLAWLQSGRLTLVDETKEPVPADGWLDLPTQVRVNAQADFERVVRGNTKAAVIFLRP